MICRTARYEHGCLDASVCLPLSQLGLAIRWHWQPSTNSHCIAYASMVARVAHVCIYTWWLSAWRQHQNFHDPSSIHPSIHGGLTVLVARTSAAMLQLSLLIPIHARPTVFAAVAFPWGSNVSKMQQLFKCSEWWWNGTEESCIDQITDTEQAASCLFLGSWVPIFREEASPSFHPSIHSLGRAVMAFTASFAFSPVFRRLPSSDFALEKGIGKPNQTKKKTWLLSHSTVPQQKSMRDVNAWTNTRKGVNGREEKKTANVLVLIGWRGSSTNRIYRVTNPMAMVWFWFADMSLALDRASTAAGQGRRRVFEWRGRCWCMLKRSLIRYSSLLCRHASIYMCASRASGEETQLRRSSDLPRTASDFRGRASAFWLCLPLWGRRTIQFLPLYWLWPVNSSLLCGCAVHSFTHSFIGPESLSVVRRTCPNPMVATNLTSELENLCPGYNSVSIF